jgi:hypothetical protein
MPDALEAFGSEVARGEIMQVAKERWQSLCEQVAREKDFDKLLRLTHEINDLLENKPHQLEIVGKPEDSLRNTSQNKT